MTQKLRIHMERDRKGLETMRRWEDQFHNLQHNFDEQRENER